MYVRSLKILKKIYSVIEAEKNGRLFSYVTNSLTAHYLVYLFQYWDFYFDYKAKIHDIRIAQPDG